MTSQEPIAKTVRDAAILLDVLTGQGAAMRPAMRTWPLVGKAIGLFEPGQWAGALHPAVAETR